MAGLVRRKIADFREKNWTDACVSLDPRDGSKFWNKFKSLTGQSNSSSSSPLVSPEGLSTTDPRAKAEIFASMMEAVHCHPQDALFDEVHQDLISQASNTITTAPLAPAPRDPIIEEEVDSIIAKPRKSSAPGGDGVTHAMIKRLPPAASRLLTNILNSCYSLGYFPPSWKNAQVVMIPKPKKPPTQPSSYRPISLISCLSKVYERILAARLETHCSTNSIIPEHQFGFRRARSTRDASLSLITNIQQSLNKKCFTSAVFLDLERAFDCVWHAGLIFKVNATKAPQHLVRAVVSFLSQRSANIRVSSELSRAYAINAGVPQGSVLSPLLFNIYCHDLPKPTHMNCRLQQYADDTALWASDRDAARARDKSQAMLSRLETWMRRWRIKPNPSKTQYIIFRTSASAPPARPFTLRLWDSVIRQQKSISYLGSTFNCTMRWAPEVKSCLDAMHCRFRLLRSLRGRLQGCSLHTQLVTYKMFIRPLVDFRAITFAAAPPSSLLPLASMERKFIRYILNLNYDHPSNDLYHRIPLTPILERLVASQSKFVQKVIQEETCSLSTLSIPPGIPRKSKKVTSYQHPPAVLLQLASDLPELPEHLQQTLTATPDSQRLRHTRPE